MQKYAMYELYGIVMLLRHNIVHFVLKALNLAHLCIFYAQSFKKGTQPDWPLIWK